MKYLTLIAMALVAFTAQAEDKNTSEEIPTAEYSLHGGTKIKEFIPKGNKDWRCLVVNTKHQTLSSAYASSSMACYPAGEE